MGRNALHTQEQVFEAADRLAASGQEVTPTALRKELGGGSLTTIYRHLDAWGAARTAAPAPVLIAMPEAVKLMFEQIWQGAANEAGKEIAAIREKADAEIKAAKRDLEEAVSAIGVLEAEQEVEADKLDALEATLAGEREAARQAATDAAAREAGLAATVEQMRAQIAALTGELSVAHAEAETARKAAQAELDRVRGQLDQATAKIEEVSTRERAKIEEAARATADAARLADALTETKQRNGEAITKLSASKQAIEGQLNEANQEIRALTEKLGQATGAADTLRIQVAEQQATIRELSAKRKADPKDKT